MMEEGQRSRRSDSDALQLAKSLGVFQELGNPPAVGNVLEARESLARTHSRQSTRLLP